ncbi:MAG TPA: DMT family transporter [Usitatibacter sp.]|nr:DMT family transporter [Usitatibacter sp.]
MSGEPGGPAPDRGSPPAGSRDLATGIACAAASVLLFSGFTLASRLGLSSSLRVADLAALRFGIGGTLLLPVLLRHGLSGLRWTQALALAFLGGGGFALLAYAGFALAPAAHGAVLLHGTLPLLTFAILAATSAERPGRARAAGLLLIVGGIAAMAIDSGAGASPRQLAGDASLLLASASWSGYGVLVRHLGRPAPQCAAIVAVLSAAAFLPVYAFLPGKALFDATPREWMPQALVQGVLVGAVSIFVYTRAVAALGPATTALFTAAVPCITTLAALPLLSEAPSAASLAGVAATTVGMALAATRAAAPRSGPGARRAAPGSSRRSRRSRPRRRTRAN